MIRRLDLRTPVSGLWLTGQEPEPDLEGDSCDVDDDNDGLLDIVETDTGHYQGPGDTGTSPVIADSDGDSVSDGAEVAGGSDPTDPFSVPASVPVLGAYGLPLLALLLGLVSLAVLQRRDRQQGQAL